MRAAIALTGSRADGEDLLQAALEQALPPTPDNIAKASITIPAGFRRLPPSTARSAAR